MSKTWELSDKNQSMHDYFSTYPGRLMVTGDGSINDQHISADMPANSSEFQNDPIFGAGGGLAFNWYYSNNGARIAVTGSYKVPYSLSASGENNDDVHGLGNEFGANTAGGQGSSAWWHDVAKRQADCHGQGCKVVGTDHGTALRSGECWGSYAIYVSESATSFKSQERNLTKGRNLKVLH